MSDARLRELERRVTDLELELNSTRRSIGWLSAVLLVVALVAVIAGRLGR